MILDYYWLRNNTNNMETNKANNNKIAPTDRFQSGLLFLFLLMIFLISKME